MINQKINFTRWSLVLIFLVSTSFLSCKNDKKDALKNSQTEVDSTSQDSVFFKLSLAQWSLHQPIMSGKMNPMDFAQKASEMGFEGLEYVTTFYGERVKSAKDPAAEMKIVLDSIKLMSDKYGMRNVLLMVDGEGDLAANDSGARNQAVENHKKWVDAAQFLGCHSIRVNLFGSEDPTEWKNNSADALSKLSGYAAEKNINVIVENHGYLSSNIDLLVEVMKQVGKDNCGTLPDFGNFCLKRENGERWEAACIEEYPRYEGIEKMMPYAKAVSAKSYDFDESGEETIMSYEKILKIVKDAGYTGFIGVEYEGSRLSPEEGINATKELLLTSAEKL
ncbi:sugar phosphate isomerase/epimerase family protein [Gramella sp. AN32]|uniref:Sugar phosphate isomerase/epimerase family protein n=1 Tax=Christiangramia antarctica TaxID=2058158 RepID=A0ABW5XBD5_9FLAO|nr:sugar phosphate isomerase/epimerase family protein [Gramella sp. AN32]MCM4156564.1 xylose isomerase [Gramella sp. AN32]